MGHNLGAEDKCYGQENDEKATDLSIKCTKRKKLRRMKRSLEKRQKKKDLERVRKILKIWKYEVREK